MSMPFPPPLVTLWMTPRAAVALNLDQLVALESHSRFWRRNSSMVVPACMNALAKVTAEWYMEFLGSNAFYIDISIRLFSCDPIILQHQPWYSSRSTDRCGCFYIKIQGANEWFLRQREWIGSFGKDHLPIHVMKIRRHLFDDITLPILTGLSEPSSCVVSGCGSSLIILSKKS